MSEKLPLLSHGHSDTFSYSRFRVYSIRAFIATLLLLPLLGLTYGRFLRSGCISWTGEPTGAAKVLSENPLIDGHNDLLILLRGAYHGHIYEDNFTVPFEQGGLAGHFDIPRAKAGQLGGSFWSAFVPCPADGLDFSDSNYATSVRTTLEQIDLFNRLSEKYPDFFTLAPTAKAAEEAWARGKLISPLIIEGLHQIGNSLATLRLYHSLGVRYATLTWNCHNKYADAAIVFVDGKFQASKPYHGGVSQAGEDLILEMNRLGIMVDLSHVSDDVSVWLDFRFLSLKRLSCIAILRSPRAKPSLGDCRQCAMS